MAVDASSVMISIVGNSNESNLILNSTSSNVNDDSLDMVFKHATDAHLRVLDVSVNALQSRDRLFDLSMAALVSQDTSFVSQIAANVAADTSLAQRVAAVESRASILDSSVNALQSRDRLFDLSMAARENMDISQNTLIASLNSQVTSLKNALNATYPIPADSVYSAGSLHNNYAYYLTPIVEVNKIIAIRPFSDASNTIVNPTYLLDTSYAAPLPSAKIYYYAGDGSLNSIIDGTISTNNITGVVGNIGTPIWTTVADLSTALIENYKYIDPSGVQTELMYSSWASPNFSVDSMTNTITKVNNYFLQRGYVIDPPSYEPNSSNQFIYHHRDINGTISIEFVYTNKPTIPNSIYFVFSADVIFPSTTAYSYQPMQYHFGIINYKDASGNKDMRQPVNIPITQDINIFNYLVSISNNTVFYDDINKTVSINFVKPNVWIYSQDASLNFNYTSRVTHTMSSFVGSFSVLKKNLDISYQTVNDPTISANPFIKASPSEPGAFLLQSSSTVKSLEYINFISDTSGIANNYDFSNNFTFPLTDINGVFIGITAPLKGNGNPHTKVLACYNNTINSVPFFSSSLRVPYVNNSNKRIGDNPYSRMLEFNSINTYIQEWSFPAWYNITYQFADKMSIYKTPESVLTISAEQVTPSLKNDINNTIFTHEHMHKLHTMSGVLSWVPAEAQCIVAENDACKYLNGGFVTFRYHEQLRYLFQFLRGYFTLARNSVVYINDRHSIAALNLSSVIPSYNVGMSPNNRVALYAESMFYQYLVDQFDKANQITRRANEILMVTAAQVLADNNMPVSLVSIVPNNQVTRFAYKQALRDICNNALLENVFCDFTVSSLFLRNNTGIPLKYRTHHPYWMYNKHNQFNSLLTNSLKLAFTTTRITKMCGWSDLDESTPLDFVDYGSTGPTGVGFFANGQTTVPFWPRYTTDTSGVNMEDQFKIQINTRSTVSPRPIVSFTLNTTPYASSRTITLEDMAVNAYLLPVKDVSSGMVGISSEMIAMDISVNRGHWSFAVVQFVPDGTDLGSWTQLPSSGNYYNVDVCGNYQESLVGAYSNVSGATQSLRIDLSGLRVRYFNNIAYYPKLVCVNRGLYDYGKYLNVAPAICRYSGEIVLTPTFK